MGESLRSRRNSGLDGSAKNSISPVNLAMILNQRRRFEIRAENGRLWHPLPSQPLMPHKTSNETPHFFDKRTCRPVLTLGESHDSGCNPGLDVEAKLALFSPFPERSEGKSLGEVSDSRSGLIMGDLSHRTVGLIELNLAVKQPARVFVVRIAPRTSKLLRKNFSGLTLKPGGILVRDFGHSPMQTSKLCDTELGCSTIMPFQP